MLLFVHGECLMGYVDVVPGWFCVATRFHHVCLIPVFPAQSWIVVSEEGTVMEGSYRGVEIGRDPRSIRWAVLEGLCTLPAVVGGVVGLVGTILQRGPGMVTVVGGGLFLVGVIGLLLLRRTPRLATFERALELAKRLKLKAEHLVLLELHFGRLDEEEARAKVAQVLAERGVEEEQKEQARKARQTAKLEAEAKARGESVDALSARKAALKAKAPKRAPKPRG